MSLEPEDDFEGEIDEPQIHDEASAGTLQPQPSSRVISVDTLRGLTILLMVFVNDLGHGAPAWMHHIRPPRADGMTLADIVFPFFLFIVGIAIPLALERAESIGTPLWSEVGHILIRSAGLLLLESSSLTASRTALSARTYGARSRSSARSWRGASFLARQAGNAAFCWSSSPWASSACLFCWQFTGAIRIPWKFRFWAPSRTGSGCAPVGGESWALSAGRT